MWLIFKKLSSTQHANQVQLWSVRCLGLAELHQYGTGLLTSCILMKIRWKQAIFAQDFIHNMPKRCRNGQFLCIGLAELHQYGTRLLTPCRLIKSRWKQAIFAQDFIHNMPQRCRIRQYLCFGLAELNQDKTRLLTLWRLNRFKENKPYWPKITSRTCHRGEEMVSMCALVKLTCTKREQGYLHPADW